jgi:hypothetical protein
LRLYSSTIENYIEAFELSYMLQSYGESVK